MGNSGLSTIESRGIVIVSQQMEENRGTNVPTPKESRILWYRHTETDTGTASGRCKSKYGRNMEMMEEHKSHSIASDEADEGAIRADNKRREIAKLRMAKEVKEDQGKGIQAHDTNMGANSGSQGWWMIKRNQDTVGLRH